MPFRAFNATVDGKNYVSKKPLKRLNSQVALYSLLDEIHRLDKTKQNNIPLLESGLVIMIGATTENPSFLSLLHP